LAKPENPDAARNLDALYDQAGNPKADASTPAQAGQGPENAAPDLWAQLERQLAVKLKIKLQSGRTRQWAEAAVEFLRNYPATPLEAAMAKALAQVHGLGAAEQALAERFFSGDAALESLPGAYVHRLIRTTAGLYAITESGLLILKNGHWELLVGNVWANHGVEVLGDRLFVSDGKLIYEVKGDQALVAGEGDFFRAPVLHQGKTYLPVDTAGLYVKNPSGEWESIRPPTLVPVQKLISVGQDLYAGANRSIYKQTQDGWDQIKAQPLLIGVGGHIDFIEHQGRLYSIGFNSWELKYFPLMLEKNGQPRPIPLPEHADSRKLFEFDGRLYDLAGDKLYVLVSSGWTRVLDQVDDLKGAEAYVFGKELYVQTGRGLMRFKDGRWLRVHDNVGTIYHMIEYRGKLYAYTIKGLFEIDGISWTPLLGSRPISGVAKEGDRLFVGTPFELMQLVRPELPLDWKDRLLDAIADSMDRRNQAEKGTADKPGDGYSTNEKGDIIDEETGRSIFSGDDHPGSKEGQ